MYKKLFEPDHYAGLPERVDECMVLPYGNDGMVSMACNPFGTLLATGCGNGEVVVWDFETRQPAGRLPKCHQTEVVNMVWSRDGHQLLSVSKDGRMVLWDMLLEKVAYECQVEGGWEVSGMSVRWEEGGASSGTRGVLNVMVSSARRQQRTMVRVVIEGPMSHWKTRDEEGSTEEEEEEEEYIGRFLGEVGKYTSREEIIPVLGLDVCKGGEHHDAVVAVVDGQSAVAGGMRCVGAFSPDGRVYVVAAAGLLTLYVSSSDRVLDVVPMERGTDANRVEFSADGNWLLLSCEGATAVPVYKVLYGRTGILPKGWAVKDIPGMVMNKGEPLVLSEGRSLLKRHMSAPRLAIFRRFVSNVEEHRWGPSTFAPDGVHVFSALASEDEHIIYSWNCLHGYAENVLEGTDVMVTAMVCHPDPSPMQLATLSQSGKIFVWTKSLSQPWSIFSPEFETLEQNRMYVESETEFDTTPAGESVGQDPVLFVDDEGDDDLDIGKHPSLEEFPPHLLINIASANENKDPYRKILHTAAAKLPLVQLPVHLIPHQDPDESEPDEQAIDSSADVMHMET